MVHFGCGGIIVEYFKANPNIKELRFKMLRDIKNEICKIKNEYYIDITRDYINYFVTSSFLSQYFDMNDTTIILLKKLPNHSYFIDKNIDTELIINVINQLSRDIKLNELLK